MPRVIGVTIPDKKRTEVALTAIYGIGPTRAKNICLQTNIDGNKRASQLGPDEINRIKEMIEKHYKIEGDLRRDTMFFIKRLKDIKAYRGVRHMKGLPVRGQRTKTNSRTRRGNTRKTAGSGRRSLDKK